MTHIESGVDEVEHQEARTPGHMDIAQNIETYHLFLQLTKWGLISTLVILILLAIFVA